MPVRAQACAAIAVLDGAHLGGRPLRVNEATDRKHGRPRIDRAAQPGNVPNRQARAASFDRPRASGFRRNPPQNPVLTPPTKTHPRRAPRANAGRRHTGGAVMAAATFAVVHGASVSLDLVSPLIVAAYALLSLLTYIVYAVDKHAARSGHWRVAESSLHLLALAGGWPGASLARHWLRHKTVKQPFRIVFAITILLNCRRLRLAIHRRRRVCPAGAGQPHRRIRLAPPLTLATDHVDVAGRISECR